MFVKFVKDDTVVLEEGKLPGQNILKSIVMQCLQAVKHVKESAKCGLKEAKDFVDTYCDYVL